MTPHCIFFSVLVCRFERGHLFSGQRGNGSRNRIL